MVIIVSLLLRSASRLGAAPAAVVGRSLVANESTITGLLERAQALGTFGADRDPRATARFVMCCMQGLNLMVKAHPDPAALDDMVDEILRALD